MTIFTKLHLTYTYNWTSTSLLNFNDTDFIDITNGGDVLVFMNQYAQANNLNCINHFNRLEYIIQSYSPANSNSKMAIIAAINKNWDKKLYRVIE